MSRRITKKDHGKKIQKVRTGVHPTQVHTPKPIRDKKYKYDYRDDLIELEDENGRRTEKESI